MKSHKRRVICDSGDDTANESGSDAESLSQVIEGEGSEDELQTKRVDGLSQADVESEDQVDQAQIIFEGDDRLSRSPSRSPGKEKKRSRSEIVISPRKKVRTSRDEGSLSSSAPGAQSTLFKDPVSDKPKKRRGRPRKDDPVLDDEESEDWEPRRKNGIEKTDRERKRSSRRDGDEVLLDGLTKQKRKKVSGARKEVKENSVNGHAEVKEETAEVLVEEKGSTSEMQEKGKKRGRPRKAVKNGEVEDGVDDEMEGRGTVLEVQTNGVDEKKDEQDEEELVRPQKETEIKTQVATPPPEAAVKPGIPSPDASANAIKSESTNVNGEKQHLLPMRKEKVVKRDCSPGKVPHRIGLSKRARIQPLLRVMKK